MPTSGKLDSVISVGEYDEAIQSFEEKAPGASGISKRYIVEAGGNVKQTLLHILMRPWRLDTSRSHGWMRKS